jgi:hypothetical protein
MDRSVEQHGPAISRAAFLAAIIEELQQGMRKRDRPAVSAFWAGFAPSNRVDERIRSSFGTCILKRRPGSPWIDAGVIIGAGDKRFKPRSVPFRRNVVFDRKPLNNLEVKILAVRSLTAFDRAPFCISNVLHSSIAFSMCLTVKEPSLP